MDWTNSVWGFLFGLLLFLLNIASLVAFFSITSTEENSDEYMSKVTDAVTHSLRLAGNVSCKGLLNDCSSIYQSDLDEG